MRNTSSTVPLPPGSYAYHVDQDIDWVRHCPGGTARIIRADVIGRGGAWDYAVTCAMKFHERPGLDNPFGRTGRWHSRYVKPVYPRLPIPAVLAELDHGMRPISTMDAEALSLMADYTTVMHTDAQAGIWTMDEAAGFRAGLLGSDSLQIHTMYINQRIRDLGLDPQRADIQYIHNGLERKVAAGEL